jgi:RNase P subunit RPR2
MKNKDKKQLQANLGKENLIFFMELLKSRENPEFDTQYIREIKKISQGFNIRLSREQKLLFCQKCSLFFEKENIQKIRLNAKMFTKNYTCPRCGNIKRFQLKAE